MMRAYPEDYLNDVVESQGKLFDFVAHSYPDKDSEDFIEQYMKSKTRKRFDEAMAYVNTMSAEELWIYFIKTEKYTLKAKLWAGSCPIGSASFMRIINGITTFRAGK